MKTALAIVLLVAACGGSPTPPPATLPSTGSTGADVSPMPPPPSDITSTTDGDVTDGTVAGIRVLVKRIPGAETASSRIYVLGGAMTWTKVTAGLEQLALSVAATGGTKQLDKDAFAKRLADLGSTINASASRDFSALTAWSLTPAWDDTFALLAQVFREPALPATQLDIERRQQIAEIQHELDDPDARLAILVNEGMFKDHPYAIRPEGTLDTVASFTPDQVASQLQSLRQTSRMMVVVVGDIAPDRVLQAVKRQLGDLPKGSYEPKPVPDPAAATAGQVEVTADKLPTNYIESEVLGPRWTDPDFPVARVAMEWLANREFEEVRTKRNLSYAPGAGYAWNSIVSTAWLYVTAVDPKATMKVMLDTVKQMRDGKISDHDLAAAKAMLLTNTYQESEAPADQGSLLAHAQIFGGDWRLARGMTQLVDGVTADQVQAWCAKHLTHFRTFVIGEASKIDRAPLESF